MTININYNKNCLTKYHNQVITPTKKKNRSKATEVVCKNKDKKKKNWPTHLLCNFFPSFYPPLFCSLLFSSENSYFLVFLYFEMLLKIVIAKYRVN